MERFEQLVKALRCKELKGIACPDCYERECAANSGKGLYCRVPQLLDDAADAIEALQAEVESSEQNCQQQLIAMARHNAELQAEVKRLEPKRGEWIDEDLDNFRKYKVTCPHCGACYIGNYDAYDEPYDFNYCPHCGNICNPANLDWENELKERERIERAKMEVQE